MRPKVVLQHSDRRSGTESTCVHLFLEGLERLRTRFLNVTGFYHALTSILLFTRVKRWYAVCRRDKQEYTVGIGSRAPRQSRRSALWPGSRGIVAFPSDPCNIGAEDLG